MTRRSVEATPNASEGQGGRDPGDGRSSDGESGSHSVSCGRDDRSAARAGRRAKGARRSGTGELRQHDVRHPGPEKSKRRAKRRRAHRRTRGAVGVSFGILEVSGSRGKQSAGLLMQSQLSFTKKK